MLKRLLLGLPLTVIILCACIAAIIALTDYSAAKSWLDILAADGSANGLPPVKFEAIREAAYAVLAALGLLNAGVILLRERIFGILAENAESFRADLSIELTLLREKLSVAPVVIVITLAVITLAGAIPRLYYLDIPIRYDEAYTYLNYVSRPALITLSLYDAPNNHILYSLCAKLCVILFGPQEWAMRLPSLVSGVLLIPGTYLLGRAVFGSSSAGLLAAGAISGSAYLIEYSINARGYSFICLFTILLLGAAGRLASDNRNLFWWTVFILSATAGMGSMPIMIYPLAIACVWLVASNISIEKRIVWNSLKPLLTALAIIVVLTLLWYTPALITGGSKTLLQSGLAERNFWHWLLEIQYLANSFIAIANAYLPSWAIPISIITVCVGMLKRPLLAASTLVLIVLFFVQNVAPFTRVLLFLVMIYLVFAGGGIAVATEFVGRRLSLSHRLLLAAAVAIAIACSQSVAWTVKGFPPDMDNAFRFPEAGDVACFLDGKINESIPVLTGVPSDNPLIFYGLQHGTERMSFLSLGMVKEKYDSLWVVENQRDYKCLLATIVESNGLDTLYHSEPMLIAEFDPVRIFLFSDSIEEK
jgi:hypothetical protein